MVYHGNRCKAWQNSKVVFVLLWHVSFLFGLILGTCLVPALPLRQIKVVALARDIIIRRRTHPGQQ